MKKFIVFCLVVLLSLCIFAGCNKEVKPLSIPNNTISENIPDTLAGLKIISRDTMQDYVDDDILGVRSVFITSYLAYDIESKVMYQIFVTGRSSSDGGISVVQLINNDGSPRLYNP